MHDTQNSKPVDAVPDSSGDAGAVSVAPRVMLTRILRDKHREDSLCERFGCVPVGVEDAAPEMYEALKCIAEMNPSEEIFNICIGPLAKAEGRS